VLFSAGMWRLVGKVLQVTLSAATAAALFVVGAVVISTLRPGPRPEGRVDAADAILEIKLSTQADTRALFAGQPLVVDLVLLNLNARRARNQVRVDPEGAAAEEAIQLDDLSANLPWEHRLQLSVSTPGGGTVLNDLDLRARLLNSDIEPSDRRLELAPARTTFVLDGDDLADLLPGPYIISAALPSDMVPPERVAVTPLEIEMLPEPLRDADRAVVSLGIARVAAMRGHSAEAVEAGLTALALDPLQDEALMVVAAGWEQQGDIERAVEWYERYYETLPDAASEQRRALEEYIEALRRQW